MASLKVSGQAHSRSEVGIVMIREMRNLGLRGHVLLE